MTGAQSLASLGITTSESFIRKLKGAADPVQCGGAEVGQASSSHSSLSKIDLAALAWRERHQGLQIPRLAPLLAEWILDALSNAAKQASKGKGNIAATSPLAQPAYYALLAELLCEPALKGASHSTLSPRLTPQSILPLATCLLKLDAESTRRCLPLASTSIGPLLAQVATHLSSSSRSSVDDFFTLACSKISDLSAEDSEAAQGIAALLEALQTPYHEAAIENSALSVKSLQSLGIDGFAKAATHLQSLSPSGDGFEALKEALWQWADGTLFNVHALRSQLLPSTSSSSSLNCVRTAAAAGTQAATEILPRLVQSALRNTRLHSGELANSLRNHARKLANAEADDAEETAAPEVATGSLYEAFQDAMLAAALGATSSSDASAAAVAARSELLEIIAESGLATQLSRTTAWSTMLRKTLGAVRSSLDGESLAHTSVVSLQLLWKLDQDLVREELDAITLFLLSKTVGPQARSTIQSFFSDLIEGFAKGQELPELLRLIQRSVAQCEGNVFDGDAAMESTWFNRAFGRAVRVQLPPTQIVEVLGDLAMTLEQASESSASADATSPGKKRARQAGEAPPSFVRQGNLFRVAHPIFASLSIPGALIEDASPSLDRIVASLRQTIEGALASASSSNSKKTKRAKSSASSSSQANTASHVIASALWAWYGLCAGQKASSAEQGASAGDHFTALDALWPDLFSFLSSNEDSDGLRLEMTRMLLFKAEKALETGVPDTWYLTTEAVQPFWTATVQRLCEGAAQQQAALWEMLARRWVLVLEHACDAESLSKLAELLVSTLRPSTGVQESALRPSSLLIVQNAGFWEMKRWRKAVVDAIQADDDSRLPALAQLPVQYLPTGVREGLILRALQANGSKKVNQQDSLAIKEWLCAVLSREGGLSEKAQQALAQRLQTFAAIKAGNDDATQQQQVNSRLFQLALKRLILARHMTTTTLQELISAFSSNDFFLARLVETLIDTSSTKLVKEIKMPAHYDLAGTRNAVEAAADKMASSPSIASVTELLDRCRLALTLASVQDKDVEERSGLASLCVSTFCSSATVASLVQPLGEATEQTSQSFLAAFAALLASCAKEVKPESTGSNSLGARGVLSFASLLAVREDLLSHPALPKEIDTPWCLFLTRITPEAYSAALDALIKALDYTDAHASTDNANPRALLFVQGTTLRTGPPKTLNAAQRFFTVALTRFQTAVLTGSSSGRAARGGWASREIILSCLRVIETVANGRGVVFRHVDVGLVLTLLSGLLTGQGSLSPSPSSPTPTPTPASQHQSANPTQLAHSIFSTLTSILSSLVRLRRDLLVPLLPQLGIVLAQISPLFRRSLPQATIRQRRGLVEGMPGWLMVATGEGEVVRGEKVVLGEQADGVQQQLLPEVIHLGASAAREFSRLLETIPAKSTSTGPFGSNVFTLAGSKKSSSGKGTSNVDSLARPFAKHAAYVLLSYVHAIVQPGVYIDAAVKRELLGDPATGSAGRRGGRGGPNAEPASSSSSSGGRGGGLTNLCGILGGGTAERDWILANDDLLSATAGGAGAGSGGSAEAGKAVFKDIWARYEAARYRGD